LLSPFCHPESIETTLDESPIVHPHRKFDGLVTIPTGELVREIHRPLHHLGLIEGHPELFYWGVSN
jgi:hypothetical protein